MIGYLDQSIDSRKDTVIDARRKSQLARANALRRPRSPTASIRSINGEGRRWLIE